MEVELKDAFSKYASYKLWRVVVEKRTGEGKGYGFVSFAKGEDVVAALRKMNGKYAGMRPRWDASGEVEEERLAKAHFDVKPSQGHECFEVNRSRQKEATTQSVRDYRRYQSFMHREGLRLSRHLNSLRVKQTASRRSYIYARGCWNLSLLAIRK
jgi:RNA recognition motif-containing protein